MRSILASAFVLMLVAFAAGCGSDGSSSSNTVTLGDDDAGKPECNASDECVVILGDVGTCRVAQCKDRKCVKEDAPDGTACPDADVCTIAEECKAGACSVQPLECGTPPAASCKDDQTLIVPQAAGTCDPAAGCTYATTEETCEKGCTAGQCLVEIRLLTADLPSAGTTDMKGLTYRASGLLGTWFEALETKSEKYRVEAGLSP